MSTRRQAAAGAARAGDLGRRLPERYAMGAVLLDAADPTHVLARSPRPILEPTETYERMGVFSETIFSCGHVPLDDRGERIRLYYGAADTCVAAADFQVADILASLERV